MGDQLLYMLTKGDRVRIREGYDMAGDVYWYIGKSSETAGRVIVDEGEGGAGSMDFLDAAIEPYPYSREERIERAIEDFEWLGEELDNDFARAVLFAVLDAEI